jgi:hypothetical protein
VAHATNLIMIMTRPGPPHPDAPHDALDSSIAPSHLCICIVIRAYEYIANILRYMSVHLLSPSLSPLFEASPAAHSVCDWRDQATIASSFALGSLETLTRSKTLRENKMVEMKYIQRHLA